MKEDGRQVDRSQETGRSKVECDRYFLIAAIKVKTIITDPRIPIKKHVSILPINPAINISIRKKIKICRNLFIM